MESPEEKIARLEAEVVELNNQLTHSDSIRGAMISASTDLALDTAVAMGRIEQLTALADACVDWRDAVIGAPHAKDQAVSRLHMSRLIDAYANSKARRS